jgi:hypothetical protein
MRFSQPKIKHLFGDGRRVADSVPVITLERCTKAEAAQYNATWKMSAPFPTIEIVRWHCKLRDERTGKAKIDAKTGEELYDEQERWFTLDNRRLYCLQQAAVSFLPDTCVADVAEIRLGLTSRTRGLRKFRTLDLGRSIRIGSRADSVAFVRWCWEEKGTTVFEYLKTLQAGTKDQAVVESSKKLSGILRRREYGLIGTGMNISFDENGWVKVSDLLQVGDFLDCHDAAQFFSVVTASNTDKFRYEMWPDSWESEKNMDEIYIRACSRVAKERSRRPRQAANGDSAVSQGSSKGKGKAAKKAIKLASIQENHRVLEGSSKTVATSSCVVAIGQSEEPKADIATKEFLQQGIAKQSPEERFLLLLQSNKTPGLGVLDSVSSSSGPVPLAAKSEQEESNFAALNALKGNQIPAGSDLISNRKLQKQKQKQQKAAGLPPGSFNIPGGFPPTTAQQAQLQKAYQMQAMFHMQTMMCAQQHLMMIQQNIQQNEQMKMQEDAQSSGDFQADMQNPWEREREFLEVTRREEESLEEQASLDTPDRPDAIQAQISKAVEAARQRNPDNQLQEKIKEVMQAAQQRNSPAAPQQNGKSKQNTMSPADRLEEEIARVMASAKERTGNRTLESI